MSCIIHAWQATQAELDQKGEEQFKEIMAGMENNYADWEEEII